MRRLALLLVAGILVAGPASAQIPFFAANVDVVSRFHWRGMEISGKPALQPGIDLSAGPITLSAWGSYVLTDRNLADWLEIDESTKDEIDLTLDYSVGIPKLFNLSLGGILYTYPSLTETKLKDWVSPEVYIGASSDLILSPSLYFYYDLNLGNGGYAEASVSHSLPLPGQELTAGLNLGYNFGQYNYDSQVSHVSVVLSDDVGFGPVSVVPQVGLIHSFLEDNNRIVLGISLSVD